MTAAATTKQMKKPIPVPSQTCHSSQHPWQVGEISLLIYLTSQLFVHFDVTIGTVKGLLEESKQDRNDDDCLKSLSKDNKEDGNRKDVYGHVDS